MLERFDEEYTLWFHISNLATGEEFMLYDLAVANGATQLRPGESVAAPVRLDVPPGEYDVAFGLWTPDRRRLYVDQATILIGSA